ncbi:MAG: hypothetical protein FJ109_09345 [Deltaproteobacteria bacterium]|nr:hypothetical protein [Deltaproteobacteria bacterium]
MKHTALLAALVVLTVVPALAGGPEGRDSGQLSVPGGGRKGPESEPRSVPYSRVHNDIGFSFEIPAGVEHEQTWPAVRNPRKFTLHAVFPAGRTFIYLFVFDLMDQDAGWWLSEVVGFLFEPENLVSSDITREGYDYLLLEMPGGGGTPPFTEALVSTRGRLAFRFTCQDCHQLSASADLDRMLDSLLVDADPEDR